MYKAIIFDLDNTLLDYSRSELHCMKQTLAQHQLNDLVWEEFWGIFAPINDRYWVSRNTNNHHISQVLEYSFADTLKELNRDFSRAGSISQTYWGLFCNSCHLEPSADRLLEQLHGRYAMGMITNGIGEAQRKRLAAGNLGHYFDSVVISDEVGYWKPDKAIFDIALKELDLRKHEVLFVGDSLTDDYMGAVNAGVDFCYYNRRNRMVPEHQKPKFTIGELTELQGLL
ncbi:YjjG family noncanonical pyrimidine nucleotidase [Paenibacillus rigui]|nr:YjjG family noncanonical pyrimidine nucleotidase [Paenibacillus rigui]